MAGWHGITVALLIVLNALVALAAYLDAKTNSPHGAVPWGLVVLFGGLLGAVCYLWLGRAPDRVQGERHRAWGSER